MGRRSNATGYVGVSRTASGKYVATVWPGGGSSRLSAGTYATAVEAAVARDRLVRHLCLSGQAPLNFAGGEPEGVDPTPTGRSRPKHADIILRPVEDGADEDDEARTRRMVAAGDKIHGRRLRAEAERIAASRPSVQEIMVDVINAVARKAETEVVRPIGDAVTALLITATAAAKAENARLDAAIAAEIERQSRGIRH